MVPTYFVAFYRIAIVLLRPSHYNHLLNRLRVR